MKLRVSVLIMTVAMLIGVSPRTQAAVEFSAGIQISSAADFYSPLEPYGSWVTLGTYGRCWHPSRVEADWRPYTAGYWEWTDAGWYWVSDEPWSWACYHYGSWYYDANYGWVWIPGTEWAPAWVSWRYGGDYVGWAPYGPSFAVMAPSYFCFVDLHHFHEHLRPRDLVFNNPTIINQTKVVNRFQRETRDIGGTRQTVVVNRGPGIEPIQRATGRTFTPKPVTEVIRETPVPQTLQQRRGTSTSPTTQQQQPNSVEQPRERTGREQQRTYEERQQQQPAPSRTERDQVSPREATPRETPQSPSRVTPSEQTKPTPEKPREVLPPTGNEQPRYREVPTPEPVQPRHEEEPKPRESQREQHVAPTVPERPLPPTSRELPETAPRRPEVVPPQHPVVPATPQVPAHPQPQVPPGQERDKDKDRPF